MEDNHIRKRWETYFHKHLKEEGDIDIALRDMDYYEKHRGFGYCRCLKVENVKCAINRMRD